MANDNIVHLKFSMNYNGGHVTGIKDIMNTGDPFLMGIGIHSFFSDCQHGVVDKLQASDVCIDME